jgi:hypothetical protein
MDTNTCPLFTLDRHGITHLGKDAVHYPVCQRVVAVSQEVVLADQEVVVLVQLPKLHHPMVLGSKLIEALSNSIGGHLRHGTLAMWGSALKNLQVRLGAPDPADWV